VLLKISGLLNIELEKSAPAWQHSLLTFAGVMSGDLLKVLAVQAGIHIETM